MAFWLWVSGGQGGDNERIIRAWATTLFLCSNYYIPIVKVRRKQALKAHGKVRALGLFTLVYRGASIQDMYGVAPFGQCIQKQIRMNGGMKN